MYETGKTAQIAAAMRRYKLAVHCLCETIWTRSGKIRLATGESLIYPGLEEEDAPHTEGVGLKLSKSAAGALLEWKTFSSRIFSAKFHTIIRKVLIVQWCDPTNDSDADKKIRVIWETPKAVVNQKQRQIY